MLSADEPIKKSEDDRLNRRSFAESLAKTIVQNSFSSSFSIGLYGKWGSGKTSIVNMVLEAVEKYLTLQNTRNGNLLSTLYLKLSQEE